MGVLYHVEPVSEAGKDLEDRAFIPESPGWDASLPSRNPTLQEVRSVLDGFDRCSVEYTLTDSGMQAYIADADHDDFYYTLVHLEGTGEEHEPHRLWFEKGAEELILEILERLSRSCGAFLLTPDTGAQPIVLYPGVDLEEVLDVWEEDEEGAGEPEAG